MKSRVRASVELPSGLMKLIDREVARKKRATGKGSRSEFLEELVKRRFLGQHGGSSEIRKAFSELRDAAKSLRKHGEELESEGSIEEARKSFLLAASKELEALSLVVTPDEKELVGDVVEIVLLLKRGTGYRHLPDVEPPKSQRPTA